MPERFRNLKTGDLVALDRLNFTESAAVAACHKGDRNPALIIASGSSDPMDIVIRIVGYIVVDNDRDPFNIDPPCEDIGGHNHGRSEEHTSELQSRGHLVCRLLLEQKKQDRA